MCNLAVHFVKCMELQRSSGDFCERDQKKTVVVVVVVLKIDVLINVDNFSCDKENSLSFLYANILFLCRVGTLQAGIGIAGIKEHAGRRSG